MSFVSAAPSYFAWHYTLPSHHKVCDFVEGEQDLGSLSYPPHSLSLQPPLANGKHKVKQHQLGAGLISSTTSTVLLQWRKSSLQVVYDCIIGSSAVGLRQWDREWKSAPYTVLDFRSDPAGGAFLRRQSAVCAKLLGLQLHSSLPSDSALSLPGSQDH